MKILLIGATGTLGKAVAERLGSAHDILPASRHDAHLPVDITDTASLHALFERTGNVDAIVATTGSLHFGPIQTMTAGQFHIGLMDKLMGQINLALIGQHYLSERGSITLTGGVLSHDPIAGGVNASTVNAALEGFVRGAAVDLAPGLRINLVSPTVIRESLPAYGPFFPGNDGVPAERAAGAYVKSIEGAQTGQIYTVWQ
ncbi:short chain dehydrogenase [Paludibacterium paludis]|uniref:Short chain dehydrogenase n=1 Tax=Paludibacterium paludis TaxID=1225769 RepID=A0A918P3B1_9NEIS|nr:short chain dehydrogenase [Paludibacterium paludis]GGY17745.1 short chain dehydrogenase [Paludibacterium paludis]